MKKQQRGFIVPLLIIIIAAAAVGVGLYVHDKNSQPAATDFKPPVSLLIQLDNLNNRGVYQAGSPSALYIESQLKILSPQWPDLGSFIQQNEEGLIPYWNAAFPPTTTPPIKNSPSSTTPPTSPGNNSSTSPSTISAKIIAPTFSTICSSGTAPILEISWNTGNQGSKGYHLDITPNATFGGGYSVSVPAGQQFYEFTNGNNFGAFGGATGKLILTPGKTYAARVYYVATNAHSPTVTFKVSGVCTVDNGPTRPGCPIGQTPQTLKGLPVCMSSSTTTPSK